jgi:hypothetical protein
VRYRHFIIFVCSALFYFSNYVNSIDSSLKSSLEKILNLRLTDLQWCQSTLPIRFGGLGIRRISDICLTAFLSSGSIKLQRRSSPNLLGEAGTDFQISK